jgi:acetolactate synthase small subunit
MQWMLLLRTAYQPKVESRILQVLESHIVEMESFSSMRSAHDIWITLVVQAQESQAARLRGGLERLQDIKRLQMFCGEKATSRTTAVVKIWCDQESRLPIPQVLTSIEVHMLSTTPLWMVFEVNGRSDRLEGLYDVLSRYGNIESFSVALPRASTEAEVPKDQRAGLTTVAL